MAVNAECRHYAIRTTAARDKVERCKLGANETMPFACPEGCVFFEGRRVSSTGWQVPGEGAHRQERR